MADIYEIIKKLPINLEGAVEYLHSIGKLNEEYLIYRSGHYYEPLTDLKKSCVDVYCTKCKNHFKMGRSSYKGKLSFFNDKTNKNIEPGTPTKCPECGASVCPVPLSRFKRNSIKVNAYYLVSVHNIDGAICMLAWSINKQLLRDGNIKYNTNALEGNVFSKDGCFKVSASACYMGGYVFYANWSVLKQFKDAIGGPYKAMIMPFDSTVILNSDFPNCKLYEYIQEQKYCHPSLYMYLYCNRPNIENILVDLGPFQVQQFIEDMIGYDDRHYRTPKDSIALTKLDLLLENAKPHDILGLNKSEYRALKNQGESLFFMRAFAHNKSSFTLDKFCELKNMVLDGIIDRKELVALEGFIDKNPSLTLKKAVKYLNEQRKLSCKIRIDWDYYIDYLTMAKRLKLKLDVYPRNLVEAHDYVLERYNGKLECERQKRANKEMEKNKSIFDKRFEQLKKFTFSKKELIITPCKSENDLFEEGNKLHHCVYGVYKTSHMNGCTAIFFLRKRSEQNKPYFTVQFDEKRIQVLQNRGYKNCDPPEEIVVFVKEWLKYCKKVRDTQPHELQAKAN